MQRRKKKVFCAPHARQCNDRVEKLGIEKHALLYCVADMSLTALKCTLGLYRDQAEEICVYLSSDGATSAGLGKLVRSMKRDRQWKLVFLHPDNPLLHASRSMSRVALL